VENTCSTMDDKLNFNLVTAVPMEQQQSHQQQQQQQQQDFSINSNKSDKNLNNDKDNNSKQTSEHVDNNSLEKDISFEVIKMYDGFYQTNLKNEKQGVIFLKKLTHQHSDKSFDSDNSEIFNDETDDNSDVISDLIGHYGLYQFMWTILLCLFQVPTTFHIFCTVFQVRILPNITFEILCQLCLLF
jgi:hypothetical protein